MKIQLCTVLTLFLLHGNYLGYSQGKCGTIAPGEEWENWFQQRISEYKILSASRKGAEAVVTIPVIVHILHNNKGAGTAENINAAQVQAAIDLMNDCFSGNAVGNASLPSPFAAVDANDINIRFCLALKDQNGNTLAENGIERVNVSTKPWGDPSSSSVISNYSTLQSYFNNKVKPATIWDPTKYFNIWTGNFISNSGGYLGFATFPPSSTLIGVPNTDVGTSTTDGVVMGTGVFGNKAKYPNGFYYNDNGYIYGITSLHEVGHYLGLRHISGDAACSDDYCGDTPAQKGGNAGAQNGLNWRCPSYPFQVNGCGSGKSPNGEMFQNFMDYSDDGCRSLFTANQETRMMTALTNSPYRKFLGAHGLCGSTIGVPEENELHIQIFPNPSDNYFELTLKEKSKEELIITMYNFQGQVIKEQPVMSGTEKIVVDIQSLSKGIYLVRINNKKGMTIVSKVVRQ